MKYPKPDVSRTMIILNSMTMKSFRLKIIIIFSGLILILNIPDSKSNSTVQNDSLKFSGQEYFIEAIPDSINNLTLIRFVIPRESFIKLYITDNTVNEEYVLAEGEIKEGEHFVYYKNCGNLNSGKCKCKMEVYSLDSKALTENFEISIK